jgi:nucleoid-associated protein YgaU
MAELERRLSKLTIVLLPALQARQRPEVPGFNAEGKLEVLFNPTEYSIDRETTFAEVAVPGLESPIIQYVRGNGDRMTFELFLDVTDNLENGQLVTGQSVRELFVRPLERLLQQNPKLHAPPPVQLLWGSTVVMESAVAMSLSVKYTLFDTEGLPVRATANLTLREHRSASEQLAELRLGSPDLTNVVIIREGDTLPLIAYREYGDATQWRPIGVENSINNPLALVPGETITVPKIL